MNYLPAQPGLSCCPASWGTHTGRAGNQARQGALAHADSANCPKPLHANGSRTGVHGVGVPSSWDSLSPATWAPGVLGTLDCLLPILSWASAYTLL